MSIIRGFKAYRPAEGLCEKIAALPYDVYDRKEAREKVKGDEFTFLRLDRPETQFPEDYDMYAPEVYAKAAELFHEMTEKGEYIQDIDEKLYIYELCMDGRYQTGIVAVASIDDYLNNVIKKHENTRADKEQDRINHVYTMRAQTGPIFLAYRDRAGINKLVSEVKSETSPVYDFVSDDGIGHRVWVIDDKAVIDCIKKEFGDTDSIYIADGHHRAASAVKVGLKMREENPGYTGEEEFNYFLSVLFPESELKILPYNRVVKDLNGLTKDEFFDKVNDIADIIPSDIPVSPQEKGTIGMYIDNKWYTLKIHDDYKSDDPVKGLDVSILQDYILGPVLGIDDPRVDKRIAFIGGIRGLEELERRCSTDMELAFSMYPTSIDELFNVADAGLLMPPKSTWFEPKLRSGIFIHEF